MNFTSDKNIDKKIERANLIIITLSIVLAKSGENISLNGHKQKPLRGKSATDFQKKFLRMWKILIKKFRILVKLKTILT